MNSSERKKTGSFDFSKYLRSDFLIIDDLWNYYVNDDLLGMYTERQREILYPILVGKTIIISTAVTAEMMEALFDYLEMNSDITQLHFSGLSGTKIDLPAVEVLAKRLENNTTIKSLRLFAVKFDDTKTVALAKMLKKNRSIVILTLSSNLITAKGAIMLAEAVEVNSSIGILDLKHNSEIGDEGAIALAKALRRNESLFALSIDTIGMTENGGARALLATMAVNMQITHLYLGTDISHECFSDNLLRELTVVLERNKENWASRQTWMLMAPLLAMAKLETGFKDSESKEKKNIVAVAVMAKLLPNIKSMLTGKPVHKKEAATKKMTELKLFDKEIKKATEKMRGSSVSRSSEVKFKSKSKQSSHNSTIETKRNESKTEVEILDHIRKTDSLIERNKLVCEWLAETSHNLSNNEWKLIREDSLKKLFSEVEDEKLSASTKLDKLSEAMKFPLFYFHRKLGIFSDTDAIIAIKNKIDQIQTARTKLKKP